MLLYCAHLRAQKRPATLLLNQRKLCVTCDHVGRILLHFGDNIWLPLSARAHQIPEALTAEVHKLHCRISRAFHTVAFPQHTGSPQYAPSVSTMWLDLWLTIKMCLCMPQCYPSTGRSCHTVPQSIPLSLPLLTPAKSHHSHFLSYHYFVRFAAPRRQHRSMRLP